MARVAPPWPPPLAGSRQRREKVIIMFYVYIIQSSKTKKFYVGATSDLGNRLAAHNAGSTRSTKNGRPWTLVHSEELETKKEVLSRESQIKRYKGGAAFKKLIGLV